MSEVYAPRYPVRVLLGGGFCLLFVLAAFIRWSFWPHPSNDFTGFIELWYQHIETHGFQGLATVKSDYSPPYLVLLYGATLLKLSALDACKLISCFFDYVLAYSVFRLLRDLGRDRFVAAFSAFFTLFLPTVFLNSAMWGQCDAIYSSFLILSLAAFLRRNDWFGWAWWSLAFSFKLQAVLFLPVLMFLWLEDGKRDKWAPFIFFPVLFFAVLPGQLAGRGWVALLSVYNGQVTQYYGDLTYNAATWLQWIPKNFYDVFVWSSVALSFGALVLSFMPFFARKKLLTAPEIVLLATFSLFLVTFLLPKMHERYFFPAEILAFVLACCHRRFAVAAIVAQIVAIFVYQPYLFGVWPPISMNLLPFGVLGVIVYLGYELYGREDTPITYS